MDGPATSAACRRFQSHPLHQVLMDSFYFRSNKEFTERMIRSTRQFRFAEADPRPNNLCKIKLPFWNRLPTVESSRAK